MTDVVRWTFFDTVTSETATVMLNPNAMSSTSQPRNMEFSMPAPGGWAGTQLRGIDLISQQPHSWTFEGVILAKAHYDMLVDWSSRLHVLQITDHLGRTFETIIQKFDPVERLPTKTKPWRADYTMTCLLLAEIP